MRKIMIIFLCWGQPCLLECKINKIIKEGQALGQSGSTQAMELLKQIQTDDLLPSPQDSKAFDPDEAYRNVESNKRSESEEVSFLTSQAVRTNERENRNFNDEEFFLKQSETIANQSHKGTLISEVNDESSFLRTCRQAGEPFLMSVERSLNVQHSEKEKHICLGHTKHEVVVMKGSFKDSTKDLRKKLRQDSSIQDFTIHLAGIDVPYFLAKIEWIHVDNAESCDNYQTKVVKEEKAGTDSEWTYEDQDLWNLSKSPDCTIIEQTCLEYLPKKDKKSPTEQQCKKERLSFFYQYPKTKECNFLKNQLCEQVEQKCIEEGLFGCALWEITFKCFEQINRKYTSTNPDEISSLHMDEWQTEYESNRSFAEVTAKLAVFEEAKKELEKSKIGDATKLEIFGGKKMTCSKSVAENLMYDCCFSYSGLAKKIGLSRCDADEISLAEMRENGLCHYVGSYDEKVLGLKSRDEHVYCCFPSKLARLVQEEGRKQLKKDWGKPKHPECGGFSFETLAKLDFSKMDLSEMCDQISTKLPDDFDDKMQIFQSRLSEQIKKDKQEDR